MLPRDQIMPLPAGPADIEMFAAERIARIVYGGVQPDSPQWERCLDAAQALRGVTAVQASPLTAPHAQAAFARCAEFNRKNPLDTKGIVTTARGNVQCRIAAPAIVYPDAFSGESVVCWFSDVGWWPIDSWRQELKDESLSVAQELCLISQQAKSQGKLPLCRALIDAALRVKPDYAEGFNEHGILLAAEGDYRSAIMDYNRAIEIDPKLGEIWNNRATAYRAIGELTNAESDLREAMARTPGQLQIMFNLTTVLEDQGKKQESLDILNGMIERDQDRNTGLYNRALCHLQFEEFEQGWADFGARLLRPNQATHYEHYPVPRWSGQSLNGARILVWTEQGLGEEIMVLSMIREIADVAAEVLVLCDRRLIPLVKRIGPNVIPAARPTSDIPATFRRAPLPTEFVPNAVLERTLDFQMSMGDLGARIRKNAVDFPQRHQFLWPDVTRQMKFRKELEQRAGGKKIVGVSWHSKKNPMIGKFKTLELRHLAPILTNPDCVFVNLQYGDCQADLDAFKSEFGIQIGDFRGLDPISDIPMWTDLVAAMDLVITTSNTTAHMAGALGRPAWVLCPSGPGKLWYWGYGRDDSLWYRSVRLFRQVASSRWTDVINRVAAELATWTRGPK